MPFRLERGRPEQVLAANEPGGPQLARAGFHGLDGRGAKVVANRSEAALAVMVDAPELSSAAPIAFCTDVTQNTRPLLAIGQGSVGVRWKFGGRPGDDAVRRSPDRTQLDPCNG